MFTAPLRASTSGALRTAARAQRAPIARSMASLVEESRLPAKFGGKYTVTLVPGDGIGPEVADSVKEVFEALKVPVEWEQYNVSGETSGNEGTFQEAMESLKRNKVGLKGILYTPTDQRGHNSWNVAMRQSLDIYASVVVCKTLPGFPTRHDDVDFAIIRENTEGEYSGLEHQSYPGVVESLKVTTTAKAERIARFAFDFALKNNRKKVTCVHKANIMKLGDGLFLNTCKRIAETEYGHTGIKFDNMIVDNASMQLVSKPQQFDVVVLPNLYGNIISNIGAALVGGPGVVPGCNFGREYALFEPGCRHVGKDIQNKNKANPTALLLSSTMLLRHLGLEEQANLIASSVYDVISEGKVRTADVGGTQSTTDFTQAVLNKALN
ncbi:isocitrate dehydrogenase (NAD(+)) idh1 [Vanrija albida]|uniref:isocitrate dehydrogenase (NAD(+)) n=1 Tax=Vanrija albida TaxID=181172 RepID=A0ABR3PS25_9TREE